MGYQPKVGDRVQIVRHEGAFKYYTPSHFENKIGVIYTIHYRDHLRHGRVLHHVTVNIPGYSTLGYDLENIKFLGYETNKEAAQRGLMKR
jgi:hypothetical protein